MKVFRDINQIKEPIPVVTIGIFDGVHLGHVEILKRIKKLAQVYKSEALLITLWPHPRLVLQPDNNDLRFLSSLDEKIMLLERQGVDNLLILPFTRQLADIPYDRFLRDHLVEHIGARHIVVGFNHHFGKDRKGTFENLSKAARDLDIQAERLEPVIIDDIRISSSGIRHMIEEGRMKAANRALGYRYFINGTVVEGQKLGRTLGYPTANVKLDEPRKMLPRNGVYAVKVVVGGHKLRGMLNIGFRPTVQSDLRERTIEVNLFDFNESLYGLPICITFFEWLRSEIKFESLSELKEQLGKDKQEVMKLFKLC